MKAMILSHITCINENQLPLQLMDVPIPEPKEGEILLKVSTCGICHTELDEIEGRLPPLRLPIILGHQVVGQVAALGKGAACFKEGDRLGIAWIFSTCGKCKHCLTGNENLCPEFRATGRDVNGGYAQYMAVPEAFSYPIPAVFTDEEAAPLLCAGAIGYRSIRLTNLHNGQTLGLTGFGASGHLVLKMVRHKYPNTAVYVFARSQQEQEFARLLGATWVGDTEDSAPEKLDAIIDTTPVWKPVIAALKNLAPGGRLVVNAIRKEDVDKDALLRLEYPTHLWQEKEIKSVANVARSDVQEFMELAAEIPIKPEYEVFQLEDANRALVELKQRKIRGAKVLQVQ